jgi:hypothetical protein
MAPTQTVPETTSLGEAAMQDRAEEFWTLARRLEPDHFGQYVMINIQSRGYVIAPTISAAHRKFIEDFGVDAPGYCLRIGASPFATA